MKYVRIAEGLLNPSDSQGETFLRAIRESALGVVSPPSNERTIVTGQGFGLFGPYTLLIPLDEAAISEKQVSMEDLNALVRSLPEHEWLLGG